MSVRKASDGEAGCGSARIRDGSGDRDGRNLGGESVGGHGERDRKGETKSEKVRLNYGTRRQEAGYIGGTSRTGLSVAEVGRQIAALGEAGIGTSDT